MCEYGFTEGEDYCSFLSDRVDGLPGKPRQGAALTLDMAKEICMLQRNEKGKQARQYFIQLEKNWNSPEKVMARALQIADQQIRQLEAKIEEDRPKLNYYNEILHCENAILVTAIAKDYGMSAAAFNKKLNELGIQYKRGGTWFLYDRYADQGYTRSETYKYTNGEGCDCANISTRWTQKGRLFLYEQLKAVGIVPVVEAA